MLINTKAVMKMYRTDVYTAAWPQCTGCQSPRRYTTRLQCWSTKYAGPTATKGKEVKEVDSYSAFIVVPHTQGAQVRITQCYLQITPYLPLPRKHSPDGASPAWGCGHLRTSNCSLLLIYLPRKNKRLSRPGSYDWRERWDLVSLRNVTSEEQVRVSA